MVASEATDTPGARRGEDPIVLRGGARRPTPSGVRVPEAGRGARAPNRMAESRAHGFPSCLCSLVCGVDDLRPTGEEMPSNRRRVDRPSRAGGRCTARGLTGGRLRGEVGVEGLTSRRRSRRVSGSPTSSEPRTAPRPRRPSSPRRVCLRRVRSDRVGCAGGRRGSHRRAGTCRAVRG